MTNQEIQQEALTRARSGNALTNLPTIYQGFIEKGIPEIDIKPRKNIFTYHAWKALGRQVRKGEHGVKINTWVDMSKEVRNHDGEVETQHFRRPRSTTVFHVSQTDAIN